jgi:hypothetical protein
MYPWKSVWRPLFLFFKEVEEAMGDVHLVSAQRDRSALI